MKLRLSAIAKGVAQVPMAIYAGNKPQSMVTLNSRRYKDVEETIENLEIVIDERGENFIKVFFAESGMTIEEMWLILVSS